MAARSHHVLKQTMRLFSPRGIEGLAARPGDELDESEVWACQPDSRPTTEPKKPRSTWTKPETAASAASLPVKIPDWSKILLHEYKSSYGQSKTREFGDMGEEEEEEEEMGAVIPPHEVVLRKRAVSLSVVEGVGRTLKGRDLSRVRNSIWAQTGFQD